MKINIESSTSCNARCIFCPRYNMTRKRGEMSDELFKKIIKDGKEMGVKYYSPFMNGEPFVFPRIWEWLDHMEKENVYFSIYTNGEYLDTERLSKYKNVWYVNCSINAATEETYNKVVRGPDYKKVMENVHKLFKLAKFKVRASMIATDENKHEMDLFRSMYRSRRINPCSNWTGDIDNKLNRRGKKMPCNVLFTQMYILWNGLVVPCCMDYNAKQVLGDVNIQSLKEIRYNAHWMRRKHKQGEWDEIPVCQNCNYNTENTLRT